MSTEKQSEKSTRGKNGGARPGAGRPKGSTHKLTAATLLKELSNSGMPFEQALAKNYIEAQDDKKLRFQYDQLFLGKLLADQHAIEIDETTTVDNRQQAFLKALEVIGGVAHSADTDADSDTDTK